MISSIPSRLVPKWEHSQVSVLGTVSQKSGKMQELKWGHNPGPSSVPSRHAVLIQRRILQLFSQMSSYL